MLEGHLFFFLLIKVHPSLCAIEAAYDADQRRCYVGAFYRFKLFKKYSSLKTSIFGYNICGKEIYKFYSIIDNMKFDVPHYSSISEVLSDSNETLEELRNQIEKIHTKLRGIEEILSSKNISASFTPLPSDVTVIKCITTIEIFIQNIDEVYDQFYQYINQSSTSTALPSQTWIDRIYIDVFGFRGKIHDALVDASRLPNHKNLVSAITGYAIITSPYSCNGTQIMSNFLVYLFNIAIIAEMKSSIMLAFVNIYESNRIEELKTANSLAREQLEEHFGIYVNIFAENLNQIDGSYMRACDPINGIWIQGVSFYEVAGVFQATIFRYRWGLCRYSSCDTIFSQMQDACEVFYYDRRSGCSSTVGNCTYLNAIKACALKSGPHKFQYVESKNLGRLGRNSECPKDNGYMIEDGWGWNFTYSACACNCYGNHNKISLLMLKSRVNSNMIITGVRFIRKNGILYIQPREGKLGANGYIQRYSQKWMRIPDNIKQKYVHVINIENRIFFFDDLRLPLNFVLTGVQFIKVTRGNVTGFAIKIAGVPFHYKSGKLSPKGEVQKFKETEPGKDLSFEPTSSAYTTLLHTLSPEDMKYVTLKQSSLQDDFGQSTLPLFDAIPVTLPFPSALGGVGIFHKGVEGYAGFISLRIYGIRYAQYFDNFRFAHMMNGRVSFDDSHLH